MEAEGKKIHCTRNQPCPSAIFCASALAGFPLGVRGMASTQMILRGCQWRGNTVRQVVSMSWIEVLSVSKTTFSPSSGSLHLVIMKGCRR